MEIKLSPLELKEFSITDFDCSFSPPEDGTILQQLFASYAVELDFLIKHTADNYAVFIRIEVNYDQETKKRQPKQGYSLFCSCAGIFHITDENMQLEEKQFLLTNSALVMTLNLLRSFIANTTGQFPLGKYWLPGIDLKHLVESKQKELEQLKKKKKNT